MRARHDAILVGSGTVLADDPDLTCRIPGMERVPMLRVVADARLRTPPTARLVAHARARRRPASSPPPATRRRPRRPPRPPAWNCSPCRAARNAAACDLRALLAALARRGVTRVLAEGGAGFAAGLLRAGLVDRLAWFHAPAVMGGDGHPAAAGLAPCRARRHATLPQGRRPAAWRGPAHRIRTHCGGRLMFTGIVTDLGTVREVQPIGGGHDLRLVIGTSPAFLQEPAPAALGASIACSGVLPDGGRSSAATASRWTASAETLSPRPRSASWQAGHPREPRTRLRIGDELGGHLVAGHVDGVAEVLSAVPENASVRWRFRVPPELAPLRRAQGLGRDRRRVADGERGRAVDGSSGSTSSRTPRR